MSNADQKSERSDLEVRRWHAYLESHEIKENGAPFWKPYMHLVGAAKRRLRIRHTVPYGRVSDFCDWVYGLYRDRKNYHSLSLGSRAERDIDLIRRHIRPARLSGWSLKYHALNNDEATPKEISSLRVNGKSLWAKPDIVFEEDATGRLVIVEVKVSDRTIPSNGWPNLKAQLWAYSHIDEWRNAPQITLVGEIWGYTIENQKIRYSPRHVHVWQHHDEQLVSENAELFELYRAAAERGEPLWALIHQTLRPKTQETADACLNRLVNERLDNKPFVVSAQTCTLREERRSLFGFKLVERKHGRREPFSEEGPLILFRDNGREILIDGNNRLNLWRVSRHERECHVAVIEPMERRGRLLKPNSLEECLDIARSWEIND